MTSEVRIGVKRLDDGRVEVKLQQLDEERTWNDPEAPPARLLATNADLDARRCSSAIEVTATAEDEPAVAQPRQQPAMCVHGHA